MGFMHRERSARQRAERERSASIESAIIYINLLTLLRGAVYDKK